MGLEGGDVFSHTNFIKFHVFSPGGPIFHVSSPYRC